MMAVTIMAMAFMRTVVSMLAMLPMAVIAVMILVILVMCVVVMLRGAHVALRRVDDAHHHVGVLLPHESLHGARQERQAEQKDPHRVKALHSKANPLR